MQILVVDESEKKAWRKSRRILGAMLFRRGSRTFTGRLSTEGTQDLINALKSVASKNTAIAVFKLTAHAEFELLARIGRTVAWGEEGWFANRVTTKVTAPGAGFSPAEKLLRLLLRLAALFHDLGKGNDQFQAMLRGKAKHQHLRHEYVSLLMLDLATKDLPDIFQAIATDAPGVFATLSTKLPALSLPAEGLRSADTEELASDILSGMLSPSEKGLFDCVRYLVLTHHRPMDARATPAENHRDYVNRLRVLGEQEKACPSLCRQINELRKDERGLPEVFEPANLRLSSVGQPWESSAWVSAVQANAKAIKRLLDDNPDLLGAIARQPIAWAKNIALVARPSLILADHLASALKTASVATEAVVYANTVKDQYDQAVLADTLPLHLLKTRYAADPFFKGLSGKHKPLPAWRPPKDSLLYQTGGPERFRWQEEAANMVREVADIADRPFMAMVVSSTGAGKTLGAPKVLAAASGDSLRYTCALGLRSLTLQTGASYRAQLGLSENSAMTVVGDALYAQLTSEPSIALTGSESLEEGAELVLDGRTTGEALGAALEFQANQLSQLASSTSLAMAEVPILTCTVDHLMGASALARGTDTRMSLRLATADLVLDEIDNYSLEDLQALARLVHSAGCYGRRVVLMSATVSETVLNGLHQAWRAGLDCWALRTGRALQPVVALVSNQVPSRVLTDEALVAGELSGFIRDISAALARATQKTKAKEVTVGSTLREAFQQIFDQAIEFARTHHTVDPSTGQSLSTGFVRFNKVTHCRQFARFLMDEVAVPPGVSLKVQCYHRRMPLFHLAHIERTLNELWARHDEHRIFAHPAIAGWHTAEPLRVVIVATTSIQETGRDHDYDFALTEPWSTRSLVQLAGRVRRHRGPGNPAANIGVLAKELNQLSKNGNKGLEIGREEVFANGAVHSFRVMTDDSAKPAFFAPMWSGILKMQPAGFEPPRKATPRCPWLPPYFFSQGIDARPCLSPAEGACAPLPYLEHIAQLRRMQAPVGRKGFFSVEDLIGQPAGHPELLWNRHNQVIEFRRQNAKLAQLTLDPAAGFKSIAVVTRHPDTGAVQLTPRATGKDWSGGTCIRNTDRCLIRTDLLTAADIYDRLGCSPKSLAAKLSHSFEAHLDEDEATTKEVYFDPLLGADTNPSSLLG